MLKLYQKSPLSFALLMIAGYLAVAGVGNILSEKIGIKYLVTAPILFACSAGILRFLRRNELVERFGLCAVQGSLKGWLYFLPLVVLASVNLWFGIAVSLSVWEIVLRLFSMVCIGSLEELLFRGFLFRSLQQRGTTIAIGISSISFGLGHVVNLLNGAPVAETVLQVAYASAMGFLFTVIFYRGKSLIPCMATHSIFNALSIFAVEWELQQLLPVATVVVVLACGYGLWILKKVG